MMSNDLNDLVLQALNEGVIVLNLKGTVTRVNRSVSLLFEKDVSVLSHLRVMSWWEAHSKNYLELKTQL